MPQKYGYLYTKQTQTLCKTQSVQWSHCFCKCSTHLMIFSHVSCFIFIGFHIVTSYEWRHKMKVSCLSMHYTFVKAQRCKNCVVYFEFIFKAMLMYRTVIYCILHTKLCVFQWCNYVITTCCTNVYKLLTNTVVQYIQLVVYYVSKYLNILECPVSLKTNYTFKHRLNSQRSKIFCNLKFSMLFSLHKISTITD